MHEQILKTILTSADDRDQFTLKKWYAEMMTTEKISLSSKWETDVFDWLLPMAVC